MSFDWFVLMKIIFFHSSIVDQFVTNKIERAFSINYCLFRSFLRFWRLSQRGIFKVFY